MPVATPPATAGAGFAPRPRAPKTSIVTPAAEQDGSAGEQADDERQEPADLRPHRRVEHHPLRRVGVHDDDRVTPLLELPEERLRPCTLDGRRPEVLLAGRCGDAIAGDEPVLGVERLPVGIHDLGMSDAREVVAHGPRPGDADEDLGVGLRARRHDTHGCEIADVEPVRNVVVREELDLLRRDRKPRCLEALGLRREEPVLVALSRLRPEPGTPGGQQRERDEGHERPEDEQENLADAHGRLLAIARFDALTSRGACQADTQTVNRRAH